MDLIQNIKAYWKGASAPSLSNQTQDGIYQTLDGKRPGRFTFLLFAGPAVVSSIAYMDPGNFASNIQAGAHYGYTLLWVVLGANLLAMLFQALSAKLGIVTNKSLAEMCRQEFPKPVVWVMWMVSELAAMATDLAEFLGGAVGLSLLFGLPILTGMAITAVITYTILLFGRSGFRMIEIVIGAMVITISVCYMLELFIAPIDWASTARGLVIPHLADSGAIIIAVSILGATVMPHAIYLHSGLTRNRAPARNNGERKKLLRYSNREVMVALAAAGMVNIAMVMMAAAIFHGTHNDVGSIETAYHILTPLLGGAAAAVFLTSLLTSGIASSVVGTMAGQMIMQDFVSFRIPLWMRRLITMTPAFVVIALGMDVTRALIFSQVILSLVLPFPMIALVLFTSNKRLMGSFANGRLTHYLALAGMVCVVGLNIVLIYQTIKGD
jgi:manganese transport protein